MNLCVRLLFISPVRCFIDLHIVKIYIQKWTFIFIIYFFRYLQWWMRKQASSQSNLRHSPNQLHNYSVDNNFIGTASSCVVIISIYLSFTSIKAFMFFRRFCLFMDDDFIMFSGGGHQNSTSMTRKKCESFSHTQGSLKSPRQHKKKPIIIMR